MQFREAVEQIELMSTKVGKDRSGLCVNQTKWTFDLVTDKMRSGRVPKWACDELTASIDFCIILTLKCSVLPALTEKLLLVANH